MPKGTFTGTATFPDWRLGSRCCCLPFFLKSVHMPPWLVFSSIGVAVSDLSQVWVVP